MRRLLSTTALIALVGSALSFMPADGIAKSEWSATGIGKDGTPPGKAKGEGMSAKDSAPGQTKDKNPGGDDDDVDDDDDGGV